MHSTFKLLWQPANGMESLIRFCCNSVLSAHCFLAIFSFFLIFPKRRCTQRQHKRMNTPEQIQTCASRASCSWISSQIAELKFSFSVVYIAIGFQYSSLVRWLVIGCRRRTTSHPLSSILKCTKTNRSETFLACDHASLSPMRRHSDRNDSQDERAPAIYYLSSPPSPFDFIHYSEKYLFSARISLHSFCVHLMSSHWLLLHFHFHFATERLAWLILFAIRSEIPTAPAVVQSELLHFICHRRLLRIKPLSIIFIAGATKRCSLAGFFGQIRSLFYQNVMNNSTIRLYYDGWQ